MNNQSCWALLFFPGWYRLSEPLLWQVLVWGSRKCGGCPHYVDADDRLSTFLPSTLWSAIFSRYIYVFTTLYGLVCLKRKLKNRPKKRFTHTPVHNIKHIPSLVRHLTTLLHLKKRIKRKESVKNSWLSYSLRMYLIGDMNNQGYCCCFVVSVPGPPTKQTGGVSVGLFIFG